MLEQTGTRYAMVTISTPNSRLEGCAVTAMAVMSKPRRAYNEPLQVLFNQV